METSIMRVIQRAQIAFVIIAGSLAICCLPAFATHYSDNFSSGIIGWSGASNWSTYQPGGLAAYRADSTSDTYSWQNYWIADDSWLYQADVAYQTLYSGSGTQCNASLVFSSGMGAPSVAVLVDFLYHSSQAILVQVSYLDTGGWHTVLNSGWKNGINKACHVKVQRQPDKGYLTVSVSNDQSFSYTADTASIGSAFLDALVIPGLRIYGGVVDFDNADFTSPIDQVSLAGTIMLENYNFDKSFFNVRIELQDPSKGTVIQRYFVPLNFAGNYVLQNVPPGTYDVAFKAGCWLQKVVKGVTITANQTTTQNVSLQSGDMDGDNHVGTPDFSIISGNFDKSGD
jgi:hypothetical protein